MTFFLWRCQHHGRRERNHLKPQTESHMKAGPKIMSWRLAAEARHRSCAGGEEIPRKLRCEATHARCSQGTRSVCALYSLSVKASGCTFVATTETLMPTGTSRTSAQSGTFSFTSNTSSGFKGQLEEQGGFLTRWTTDGKNHAARQHMCRIEILWMCRPLEQKDERWRTHLQQYSTRSRTCKSGTHVQLLQHNTNGDDRAARGYVAHKWQFAPTNQGGHNSTKSTNHPEYRLETEVYSLTEVSRCTQQGEIPRTDVFAN